VARIGLPGRREGGPTTGRVARPGQIRSFGPVAVLAVPLALALVAAIIIQTWPCDGTACGKPYAGAWGLVLFALPTALATGIPWIVSPINVVLALGTSLALWVVFGRWASQRATEDVDATWWTFWREVAFYAGGAALGVVGGLLVMVTVVTFL
jgi:hypothetical protein